jgi:hypothetical protein
MAPVVCSPNGIHLPKSLELKVRDLTVHIQMFKTPPQQCHFRIEDARIINILQYDVSLAELMTHLPTIDASVARRSRSLIIIGLGQDGSWMTYISPEYTTEAQAFNDNIWLNRMCGLISVPMKDRELGVELHSAISEGMKNLDQNPSPPLDPTIPQVPWHLDEIVTATYHKMLRDIYRREMAAGQRSRS